MNTKEIKPGLFGKVFLITLMTVLKKAGIILQLISPNQTNILNVKICPIKQLIVVYFIKK